MSHPASCTDPNCDLSYRDHLLSVNIAPSAHPTRSPDAIQTNVREQRWHKDHAAFRRLHKEGHTPDHIDGSAFREAHGETVEDLTTRRVSIDRTRVGGETWHDPKPMELPVYRRPKRARAAQ